MGYPLARLRCIGEAIDLAHLSLSISEGSDVMSLTNCLFGLC